MSEEEYAAMREQWRIEDEKRAMIRQDVENKKRRVGYSSLPEHEWTITFETMPICEQNRAPINRLACWVPQLKKGAVIYGTVGTGKSTICKALINRYASPTRRCLFISVTDALKTIKGAMDRKDTTVEMECNKLVDPAILVFDDLGVDNCTEWAREQIFSIFEARTHSGKHTFFTTNLTPDQIRDVYKERIHDRMLEWCSWIQMTGESFRKRNFENEI